MAYANYTYYSVTYGGTAISSAAFTRLAIIASAKIDLLTFDRAADVVTENTDAALIEKIKLATCAVAEEIQRQEANGGEAIQSERVGNFSVTYSEPHSVENKISNAAKTYLGNTGLMFTGFNENEYGSDPL